MREGPERTAYEAAVAEAEEGIPRLDERLAERRADLEALAVRVRAEEWGTTKDTFGLDTPVVPPEYVGLAGEINRLAFRRQGYLDVVERALGAVVGAGLLVEGDRIRSPLSWFGPELEVAEILNEHAGQLRTVIVTADGRYVATDLHEWPWDDETHTVVRDPDVVGVRYEHWWVGGMRVGGLCHPASRRVIESDPVR